MCSRLVVTLVLLSLADPAAAQSAGARPGDPPGPAIAEPAEPPPPPPPPGPGLVAIDLRPRIYVKDLDHLAELVREDPTVAAKASSIASRRTNAMTVGGVTIAAGMVVFLTGMGNETCRDEPVPFPGSGSIRMCQADSTQSMIGLGITAAGSLLVALLWPGPNELLDVINDWNVAHPDRPFELGGGHHPILDQVVAPGQR
ncbi:MAG TPA: hypothetical protein VFR85_03330 [Anaeromyxobacteraceae bacterium]|nr:hypothetical protein [Anaeromyxobacteraceae bacterium]